MASLLDKENLDKLLGITPSVVPDSLLGTNFDQQANVATALGFAAPLIQQGITPESLLKSYIGASAGRQGIVDKKTKNYMTSQGIIEQGLKNKKLGQDIGINQQKYLINQDKIGAFGEEALIRQNKIIDLQNKNYLSSLRNVGIKDRFKQLQEKADGGDLDALKQLQQFSVQPEKYMEFEQSKGINNLDYSQGELSAARLFKLDVRNRKNWTEEEEAKFNAVVNAPSVQEAEKINRENLESHRKDPINIPYNEVLNVNQVISKIRQENKENLNNNTIKQVIKESVGIGKIEPNQQYPEGGFKANNGKIYSLNDWNDLGIERQNVYSLDTNRTETNENIKEIYKNAKTDALSAQYGARNVDRTNKAIERILDNPEKFKKLFSTFGGRLPIAVNKVTGNFIATESDAQDIVNMLNTIKGQQFTNEIQVMRNNNKTGGAVGNVSDKEVEMFQNMAANLRYNGTPEELWYQLNLLRNQGKKTVDIYTNNFATYYGKDQAARYNIQSLSGDYSKQYNDDWQDLTTKLDNQAANTRTQSKDKKIKETTNDIAKKKNIDRILKR